MSAAVVGFDIGGGSGRALVLDLEGGGTTVSRCTWPQPRGAELDLEAWFERLCGAARAAHARAGHPRIVGVAAAAMRFSTVIVDPSERVVLASPNRDARGAGQSMAVAAAAGARLQALTGHWPMPILGAARLRWLRETAPTHEVGQVLALNDWFAWRLCGEFATDHSQAAGTGYYDLEQRAFAGDAAAAWGGSLEGVPSLGNSGDRLGSLGEESARALGFDPGIAVAIGGADSQLAALAAGALEVGDTALVCGTTLPIQRVVAQRSHDPTGRLWAEPHVVSGRSIVESNAGPVGESLDWLGAVFHADAPNPAARLLARAGRAPAGASGLVSHFGAQVMDARALSLPVGELTLSHMLVDAARAGDAAARAFVEGLAHAARANLEQLDLAMGAAGGPLRLAGGMARSEVWARVLAGVCDRRVEVASEPESSALGAALCAAVGAGYWADLDEAARAVVRTVSIEPDAAERDAHAASHARWQELREARAGATGVAQGHAIQALLAGAAAAGTAAAGARPRILVTADLDPAALARLRSLGDVSYESYREVGRLLSGQRLVDALQGYQVFVTEIDLVDGASLIELLELRAIGVCRGDAVNVDAEACARVGIPVVHTPGRNADAVADLTLAFLLALARKLPEAAAFLRDPAIEAGDMGAMGRAFGTLRGRELWGKTVGLIGLGAVGRKVAERLQPFGARVLVHDPFLGSDAVALTAAQPASFEDLLHESDFVSLHAAVTEASRGMIGADAIASMKDGAALVNTARAALVDEGALAAALESGKLGGAALDVFSVEPPGADHPLLRSPNLIATPHLGGNTLEVGVHQGAIVASELERLLRGERPRHLVKPEALAAFSLDGPRAAPDPETVRFLRARPDPAVTDLQRDAKKPSAVVEPEPAAPTLSDAKASALRAVLEAFADDARADASMRRAAAGRDVLLRFGLTDAALSLTLELRAGEVNVSLRPPDTEPDVELKMTAATFDGMLSGRVNAMQAATRGEISFAGDAGKAMTLQEIQADLERVYNAVCARLGALSLEG